MFQGTFFFFFRIWSYSLAGLPSVFSLWIMLSLLLWKSIFSDYQKRLPCVAVSKLWSYYSFRHFRGNRQFLRSFNIQAPFSNSYNSGSICCTLSNVCLSFVKGGHQSSAGHVRLYCHFGVVPVLPRCSGPLVVGAEHKLVHSCAMICRQPQTSVLREARIRKRT